MEVCVYTDLIHFDGDLSRMRIKNEPDCHVEMPLMDTILGAGNRRAVTAPS